ncbi:hypothetical protein PAAG_06934 [Paracoccidioides lutzii Pb01]|uniref:Uncharacterized protein n=1 Tax=Paracoccidioides lutzii (strain ATCC MYA-826 / Pb01) TaxID=502779 RepID=C1H8D8_PARBA|nr:hypothetical protein PAAG_06934 [Paracoccidioides lutzii Pb01]EEH36516.2 hypothetical protein PAAG_06934 [Paracoccidioides lutzii Pb01]
MESGLSKDVIVKIEDIIALVAEKKGLGLVRRLTKNMYIEDVTEFARVLLTITEMTFDRPGALLHLQDIRYKLTLIRDPEDPEIIFDPTLVLSPHVCLEIMLFHIGAFKRISTTGPVLDSAENLYSPKVLKGKGQQELPLKNELLDNGHSLDFKSTWRRDLTASTVGSRMRRGGEITGFDQVAHPYNFEMLQPRPSTAVKRSQMLSRTLYFSARISAPLSDIKRWMLMWTHRASLSTEESRSLNFLSVVLARQDTVNKRKQEWEDRKAKLEQANIAYQTAFGHLDKEALSEYHFQLLEKLALFQDRIVDAKHKHNRAVRELRNEKQRQRTQRIQENLTRYRNEHISFLIPNVNFFLPADCLTGAYLIHRRSQRGSQCFLSLCLTLQTPVCFPAVFQRLRKYISLKMSFTSSAAARSLLLAFMPSSKDLKLTSSKAKT